MSEQQPLPTLEELIDQAFNAVVAGQPWANQPAHDHVMKQRDDLKAKLKERGIED